MTSLHAPLARSASPEAAATSPLARELKQLKALKDQGILDQAAFAAAVSSEATRQLSRG